MSYYIRGQESQGLVTLVAEYSDGNCVCVTVDNIRISTIRTLLYEPARFTRTEEPKTEQKAEPVIVNINKVSGGQLKLYPGMNARLATRILGRKPENGYKSVDEIKEINADLKLNWDELQSELTFVVA